MLTFNMVISAQQFNQITQLSPTNCFNINNFIQLNDNLIYITYGYSSSQSSLMTSTGTYSGTSLLMNFQGIQGLVKSGSNVFFRAQQGTSINSLWKTNGTTANTLLVIDLTTRSFCSNLCDMNGTLYFITKYIDQVNGNLIHELWKSDGTQSGTVPVKDWTNSGFGNSIYIREFNNKIYFAGNESDGTFSGTIQTGVNLPTVENSSVLNGFIYYSGTDGKLWKTNGTISGTLQAVNFPASGNFYTTNGWIYFAGGVGGSSSTGVELCRTDGTLANTTVIKDIYTGFNSSNPNNFIYHNGNVFFTANDGLHGYELWKTDGTTNGTALVKDIFTGSIGIAEFNKTIHDSQFYFTANRGEYGNYSGSGVWKSDGSEINTVLVQSFDSVGVMLEVNCNLFLSAVDSVVGVSGSCLNSQLWCDTSLCTSADINESSSRFFTIFPNPTLDVITMSVPANCIYEEYYLLDFTGRIVLTGFVKELEEKVDLSMLENGTYFLKIAKENSFIKILKE